MAEGREDLISCISD